MIDKMKSMSPGKTRRVTVTLPSALIQIIDGLSGNRSKFIVESVNGELERRRREGMLTSLNNPHAESQEFESLGAGEWFEDSHAETADIVDPRAGEPVRWSPGSGWASA